MESTAQTAINEAREIMESFDDHGGTLVFYNQESYTLTQEQMTKIAGALYLADCEIGELSTNQCKCNPK
jgi:hypothetical protein